jgi:flagellar assembly protein FliH
MPWSDPSSFEAADINQYEKIGAASKPQKPKSSEGQKLKDLGIEPWQLSDLGEKLKNEKKSQKDKVEDFATENAFRLDPRVKQGLELIEEENEFIEREVGKRVHRMIEEKLPQSEKEGYEKGYEDGYQKGKAQALEDERPQREALIQMLEELSGNRSKVLEANKQAILDIVFHVCRYILLKEVEVDKDYLIRLVTQLVEKSGSTENIKIYLSPEDYSRAMEVENAIHEKTGQIRGLSVDMDENVSRGGCRVETQLGVIDADLSTQLGEISKVLRQEDQEMDVGIKEELQDRQKKGA